MEVGGLDERIKEIDKLLKWLTVIHYLPRTLVEVAALTGKEDYRIFDEANVFQII